MVNKGDTAMFEEMAKLESMDYTLRQIRAMLAEGTSVEFALNSMERERIMRMRGLAQRMTSMARLMEINVEVAEEDALAAAAEANDEGC